MVPPTLRDQHSALSRTAPTIDHRPRACSMAMRRGRPYGRPLHLKLRRRLTLPGAYAPSTISAGGLNFRVRNGNGWFPAAITTGNRYVLSTLSTP